MATKKTGLDRTLEILGDLKEILPHKTKEYLDNASMVTDEDGNPKEVDLRALGYITQTLIRLAQLELTVNQSKEASNGDSLVKIPWVSKEVLEASMSRERELETESTKV